MVYLPDIIGIYCMLGVALISYMILETNLFKKIPFGHDDASSWSKKKFLVWFFVTGFLLMLTCALLALVWPVILFKEREEVINALGR